MKASTSLAALLVVALAGCTEDAEPPSRDSDTVDSNDATAASPESSPNATTTSGSGTSEPAPDEDGSSGTTTGPGSTTVSEGDACPLLGMFRECSSDTAPEGRSFCDDFDGELAWGPCTSTTECELDESSCEGECVLEDGVPTWSEIEGGCGESSG